VHNASTGLQSPEIETQLAREFVLRGRSGLAVLIADPFELFARPLFWHRGRRALRSSIRNGCAISTWQVPTWQRAVLQAPD
jgi:hypothetical protein